MSDLPGILYLYLVELIDWLKTTVIAALAAYHLNVQSLYWISLAVAIVVLLPCLMVKAFTLGKQAAERTARGPDERLAE